ncbi:MAG: phosphatidate cytidylyltransferase [Candidatus Margulisbacteria bacterium]|nr:phosphatidate cytidylyltransferase [Candidatus Margulisiibacteriota bacterium]
MNNALIWKEFYYLLALLAMIGSGIAAASVFLVKKKMKAEARSLWIKYLVWYLIIPVLFIPILLGKSYFVTVIMILSLLCYREFTRATGLWQDKTFCWSGYLSIAMIFAGVYMDWYGLYTAMPIYCTLAIFAIPILRGDFKGMIQKTCLTVLGILYFGWFFSHVAFLSNMEFGMAHAVFLFILVELNDASAFICGKIFGKHKLNPNISPNKTWEGTVGALLITILFSFVFRFAIPEFSLWQVALIGILISIGGTLGDLTISFIKRDLDIKDMGKLIPGHGGLLDRFDSLIFAAPIFFHFTRYFFWTMFFKP